MQDNWPDLLATAKFTYNNTVHSAIGVTPFFANYGLHPRFDPASASITVTDDPAQLATNMSALTKYLRGLLSAARDDMKKFADAHRRPAPNYQVGDYVYINSTNIRTICQKKKLDDKWIGPFPIDKQINASAYRLVLPPRYGRLHPVFHVSQLQLAPPDKFKRKLPEPISDGQDTALAPNFEVEDILDSRVINGTLEYKIRWAGYDSTHDTWEPSHQVYAPDIIKIFHQTNRTAPSLDNPLGIRKTRKSKTTRS